MAGVSKKAESTPNTLRTLLKINETSQFPFTSKATASEMTAFLRSRMGATLIKKNVISFS